MKSSRTLFLHILDAIASIEQYTDKVSKDEFLANFMLKDAVVRNLEIIGEASRNIDPIIKSKIQSIPWRDINAMRNKLIHEYFGVDNETVWFVVQFELPELKKHILEIIKSDI